MTLFMIFISLLGVSLILIFLCLFMDWNDWIFIVSDILLLVSGLGMIICVGFSKPDIKPIEYPASEYDFKIKVVEFEEQKDTILVVIPKEKNKDAGKYTKNK